MGISYAGKFNISLMGVSVGLQKSDILQWQTLYMWATLYMVINIKSFQNNVQPLPPF
jgi:hypothetical protein